MATLPFLPFRQFPVTGVYFQLNACLGGLFAGVGFQLITAFHEIAISTRSALPHDAGIALYFQVIPVLHFVQFPLEHHVTAAFLYIVHEFFLKRIVPNAKHILFERSAHAREHICAFVVFLFLGWHRLPFGKAHFDGLPNKVTDLRHAVRIFAVNVIAVHGPVGYQLAFVGGVQVCDSAPIQVVGPKPLVLFHRQRVFFLVRSQTAFVRWLFGVKRLQ